MVFAPCSGSIGRGVDCYGDYLAIFKNVYFREATITSLENDSFPRVRRTSHSLAWSNSRQASHRYTRSDLYALSACSPYFAGV